MTTEHTQDINGAFPAHAALEAQIKRHPSGYNATLYDTGYKGDLKDCESVYYKDLLAEFTALKQAADGMYLNATRVMKLLEEYPDGKAVPHLIDTDDNAGEFLRQALTHYEQLTREKS